METLIKSPYLDSREKRRLDYVVSTLALPVTRPVERYVGRRLLRELNDGGDIYFTHQRKQSDGSVIHVRKLRTMFNTDGPSDTELGFSKENPRIPSDFVKKIRASRLDELPQIESVRDGEASMVGPRSMDQEHFDFVRPRVDRDLYDTWLPAVEDMQSGLTGLAQLSWIHENERPKEVIERSMLADLKYYQEASLRVDVGILTRTAYQLARAGLKNRNHRE